jgi:hypothetical protein
MSVDSCHKRTTIGEREMDKLMIIKDRRMGRDSREGKAAQCPRRTVHAAQPVLDLVSALTIPKAH